MAQSAQAPVYKKLHDFFATDDLVPYGGVTLDKGGSGFAKKIVRMSQSASEFPFI
jgi:hypothetical protein